MFNKSFILKSSILLISVLILYIFDNKQFRVFGGISISDILIIFLTFVSLIFLLLSLIFNKYFINSRLKKIFYSVDYILFISIVLVSIVFIKYLNKNCDTLSDEQKCICSELKYFQNNTLSNKNQYIDSCSQFREIIISDD